MYENDRDACLYFAAETNVCGESLAMDGCADTMVYELDGMELEARGRMIELMVRIRDVCPGKRVALGVMLHETDGNGAEEPRGMRTFTVPAHNEECNQDILVRSIRFVLPEDLSMAGANGQRLLAVRTMAHYIDLDSGEACGCRRRKECDRD